MNKIPLAKPWINHKEWPRVMETLDTGFITDGEKAREFENLVKNYIGSKHAVAVTSCTAALFLALKALGIKQGDEVVVPAYTYPATAFVVNYCNATPVFCDVDLMTYNTTFNQIKQVVTDKTKAIIPVHLFGLTMPMEKLQKFCNDNEIFLVEDAACALGSKFDGKFAGTLSDIGCFAFHARKVITTGEGGMCVTDNSKLAEKLNLLKRFGFDGKRDFLFPALNFKFSDILASVGIGQMNKIKDLTEARRGIAKFYNKTLDKDFLMPPLEPEGAYHIYQSYVVTLKKTIDRDKVIEYLKSRGIETQIGTYAVHSRSAYKLPKEAFPNAQHLFEHSLALPCWYGITKEEIEHVVSELHEICRKLAK